MRVTSTVQLCPCGCGKPFVKTKSGNQIYLPGHSPHGHYGARNEARKQKLTQQGPKPEYCGHCRSASIYGDDVRDSDSVVTIWCCWICGWRKY